MSSVLEFLYYVAVFIPVVGVIIFIHEMGHYWVGRWMDFAIEAFSLGFGPKIWERKGPYNAWQVRWILMGGFVKFVGEMDNPDCEIPEGVAPSRVFPRKKRWQRFLVLLAGVGFNILSAYLLFSGLAWYGIEESLRKDQPALVGQVAPGSPAEAAGVRRGDVIRAVDGREVDNWEAAEQEIFTLMSRPYPLELERDGKPLSVTVTPLKVVFLKQPMGVIGVYSAMPPVIGGVVSPSPAQAAGLLPGDRIESVDGRPVEFWDEVQAALAQNGGQPVSVALLRGEERLALTVTPQFNEKAGRFLMGVEPRERVTVRYPFPRCFVKAFSMVGDQVVMAYRTFAKLLERKIPVSALSGPQSLAYITGEVARTGLYNLLAFIGTVSILIAIFNILPIPGLDGGHILILGIEAVLRRDLPLMVKEWIMRAGFALLILLFVAVLTLDFVKFL